MPSLPPLGEVPPKAGKGALGRPVAAPFVSRKSAIHFPQRGQRRTGLAKGAVICDKRIAPYEKGYAMPISIRLPDDVEARLSALSARTGRSKTFYVTQAIREQLEDLEDIYLAELELIEVRAGRSVPISLQEAMTQYGLED